MTEERKHLIRVLELEIQGQEVLFEKMNECYNLAKERYREKLLNLQNLKSDQ